MIPEVRRLRKIIERMERRLHKLETRKRKLQSMLAMTRACPPPRFLEPVLRVQVSEDSIVVHARRSTF
jgi:hypothetical protein